MRAKSVLLHLVNCDQTTYVKGRNIGESITLIDDLMGYAEQENFDGLIFAVDIDWHLTQWIIISSLQV